MAVAWGEYVRTPRTNSWQWTGSLTAGLFPAGAMFWNFQLEPTTGFAGVSVSGLGVGASIGFEGCWLYDAPGQPFLGPFGGPGPGPGDPRYEVMAAACAGGAYRSLCWVFVCTVSAGWEGGPPQTASSYHAAAWQPPQNAAGDDAVWLTLLEALAGEFTFTASGIVLKRAWGLDLPQTAEGGAARGHMHPLDARVRDGWHATPGAVVSASFKGLSVSAARRDAYPPGTPDRDIGDAGVLFPYTSFGMSHSGPAIVGQPIASLSISGANFSGMIQGTDNAAIQAHGDGNAAVLKAVAGTIGGGSWSGGMYAPLQFDWVPWGALWDETDRLDPPVLAGLTNSDGSPRVPAMSQLPAGNFAPFQTWGGERLGAAPPQPLHPGFEFAAEIEPFWAMNHWCDPSEVVFYSDKVAELHDRFICLHIPGVNSASTEPWEEVATLSRRDANAVPLVARPGGEDRRWTASEGITVGTPQEQWTIAPGASGEVTGALLTRYWDRLAVLQSGLGNWHWPKKTRQAIPGVDVELNEPTYPDDVASWKDHGWLKVSFEKPADLALVGSLTLRYSEVEVTDPHYACNSWRSEEFEYARAQGEVSYPLNIPAGQTTAVIDLLCPQSGETPTLFIVDEVVFGGLQNAGETPLTLTLTELRPCGDQGWDHTGRGSAEDPLVVANTTTFKSATCWDFLTDFGGLVVYRDGCLKLLELPDEPNRGGQVERGLGQIEKLVDCPTNPTSGERHFARPLNWLGFVGWQQGCACEVPQAALDHLTTSFWKGLDAPEVLCTPALYWTANALVRNSASIKAAVHARSWSILPGIGYTLHLRKRLGGSALTLLKSPDGRRRLTPQSEGIGELRYVMRRRITRYFTRVVDYGEGTVTETTVPWPGAPLPEVGRWQPWRNGLVTSRLDPHGVFEWPGMTPGRTRVNNPQQSQADASQQTTFAEVEYRLELWWSDAWQGYDPNDVVDWARAEADQDFGGLTPLAAASRRYGSQPMTAAQSVRGGNHIRMRNLGEVICRGGRVWTRRGVRAPWEQRQQTVSPAPLLVRVRRSDDVALLDSAVFQSQDHGRTWESGLPPGVPAAAVQWMETAVLRAARLSSADHVGVAVGTRRAGPDTVIEARWLSGEAVTVATLAAAELDGLPAWPWLHRLRDGVWVCGAFIAGDYREWRSTRADGSAWGDGTTRSVGEHARLSNAAFWRPIDRSELVAGYHRARGEMLLLRRPGPNGDWSEPIFTQTAPYELPYVVERPSGHLEVGWLQGGEWRRFEAAAIDGPWSEL